jgi:hypothetical protein
VQPQILWQRTEALLRNGECAQALAILRRLPRLAGARQDAAQALCELVTGEAWTHFDSPEPVVSQEFLRWYRTLLADNAGQVISTVNGRLDRLRELLPSVSRTLEQALAEAGTEAAVA